jgi:hypothetical protein
MISGIITIKTTTRNSFLARSGRLRAIAAPLNEQVLQKRTGNGKNFLPVLFGPVLD